MAKTIKARLDALESKSQEQKIIVFIQERDDPTLYSTDQDKGGQLTKKAINAKYPEPFWSRVFISLKRDDKKA